MPAKFIHAGGGVGVGVGIQRHAQGYVNDPGSENLSLLVGLVNLVIPLVGRADGILILVVLSLVIDVSGDVGVGGSTRHAAHQLVAVAGMGVPAHFPANQSAALIGTLGLIVCRSFPVYLVYLHRYAGGDLHVAGPIDDLQELKHGAADTVGIIVLHIPLKTGGVAGAGSAAAQIGVEIVVHDRYFVNGQSFPRLADNVADAIHVLICKLDSILEEERYRRRGLGTAVLEHEGPVLARRDDDVRVPHPLKLTQDALQLLLGGDPERRRPLGGGGHHAHVVPVTAVQAAVLGVARQGQLGQQGLVLARPDHHRGASGHLEVRIAAVLQVARNLAGLLGSQVLVQLHILGLPLAQRHGQDDNGHQDHRQDSGQYDAHFLAHVFEEVLDLLPKTFQLGGIHTTSPPAFLNRRSPGAPSQADAVELAVSAQRLLPHLHEQLRGDLSLVKGYVQRGGVVQLAGREKVLRLGDVVLRLPHVVDEGMKNIGESGAGVPGVPGRLNLAAGKGLPQGRNPLHIDIHYTASNCRI